MPCFELFFTTKSQFFSRGVGGGEGGVGILDKFLYTVSDATKFKTPPPLYALSEGKGTPFLYLRSKFD